MTSPALRMNGIVKRFGANTALAGVDFEVAPGEIHALLGENGAGKSTLMKILYGLVAPDAGTIELDGRPARLDGPRQARAAGVGMVQQHLMLVESLTVAENLALDAGPARGLRYRRRHQEAHARELAARFGLALDPARQVADLSLGERQRVDIVKALAGDARILVLDEPTTVLTPLETAGLFASLRALAAQGRCVIFISHKLSEVLELAARVTVLRDGRAQGTLTATETSASDLARRMVGRDVAIASRGARDAARDVVLSVQALRVEDPQREPPAEGVSFDVRAGEIVAVAGVEGNGQLELCQALAGIRPIRSGRIRILGADITALSPLARAAAGLGVVPADRTRDGIVAALTLAENLALKAHRRPELSWGPFARLSAWRERAERLLAEHGVRPAEPEMAAASLSGGNQQKLLMARELAEKPAALVATHPTRGLDVGATEALHAALLRAREAGMAILLVSAELDEVLALADRVLVAFRGRLLEAPLNRDAIGLLMGGEGAGHASA